MNRFQKGYTLFELVAALAVVVVSLAVLTLIVLAVIWLAGVMFQ